MNGYWENKHAKRVIIEVVDAVGRASNLTESTIVNQLLLRIKELASLNQTEG
jgi:hypothetical protein